MPTHLVPETQTPNISTVRTPLELIQSKGFDFVSIRTQAPSTPCHLMTTTDSFCIHLIGPSNNPPAPVTAPAGAPGPGRLSDGGKARAAVLSCCCFTRDYHTPPPAFPPLDCTPPPGVIVLIIF